MFCGFDTRDSFAVERETRKIFHALFRGAHDPAIPRAFGWARDLFAGRHPDRLAIDARYHDFEHTLQGTLCLARLMEGRQFSGQSPPSTPRAFELAIVAILFHDTGYLKSREDLEGTGAKYTPVHVARGAEFAGKILRDHSFAEGEILTVQNMIRCTAMNADLAGIPFQSELERDLGCAVGTADLIGQMAADDYVDKLPLLFQEFEESYRANPPQAAGPRRFQSAADLIRGTAGFWEGYVFPRLGRDFRGMHRFLARPDLHGPNPYLEAIQSNLARLRAEEVPVQRS